MVKSYASPTKSVPTLRVIPPCSIASSRHVVVEGDILVKLSMNSLGNLMKVDMSYCIIAVEDSRNLLERRTLSLWVEEINESQLHHVPQSVEQHEIPMLGEVVPREFVRLAKTAVSFIQYDMGRNITDFPIARIAWTVMFMIIMPLARRWKGRISRA